MPLPKIYKNRKEKAVRAVARRRVKVKAMAVDYKGGKCCVCGYNKFQGAMDFHHINSEEKSFGIAHGGHCISWEKLKKELDKCVLLCANCHREVEGNYIRL